MMRRLSSVCAFACAALAIAPLPASADSSSAGALSAGLVAPANALLQRALRDVRQNGTSGEPADVAQANPPGTPQAPLRRASLPQGFSYNLDVSFAYPLSNVGFNAGDSGGMNAGFGCEIQQAPVSFSNVSVPAGSIARRVPR